MKRWKSIVLGAGLLSAPFATPAVAQQGAEPPKTLAVEVHAEPSSAEALVAASNAVTTALAFAPNGLKDAPPDAPETEGTSGAEEAPAMEQAESVLPTVEELLKLGDVDTVEDVEETVAEIETPPVEPVGPMPDWSADDFKYTLQLLRRVRRSIDDGVEQFEALSARLTNPARAGMLDLTPYVDSPAWAEVVTLLYDDKCKEAKTKAEALAGDQMSSSSAMVYFHARIQMCAGEEKAGRATLRRLSKGDGPVAILAARRLGNDIIVTEGEEEEGMYLSQRLRQAKKRALKDPKGAVAELDGLYEEMTRRWDRFKVRQTQAQILEASGQYEAAGEAYLALYRKTRGWKVNESIEDQIERLERKTKKKFLDYGERIDRMRHLVARGRYKEAKEVSIENAKIRGVSGNEVRGWMYYRLALQAEREKERKEAVALFEKAERLVKDNEVRPRLYFGWARALRRLDRDSEAVKLYARLVREYPKSHLCDEATYEAGRLLQFANRHDEAVAKFHEVAEKYPESDFVPDALWREALSRYLQGEYADALGPLERLRADFADERDESELTLGLKATYWLAMAHLKKGDAPNAERLFQETIDRGPLTWYGRLAVARMDEAGWTPSLRLPDSRLTEKELRDLASLRVPQSPRLDVAAEYVRLGLWKDALSEMRDQVAIHPVPDGAHRLLASIYLANGRPDWAHWIMKKHVAESGPTRSTLRDWGTAFPLDYMDLAHENGTKHSVSPFLVQAIIRQESGFRPTVSSWAGAVGLMQLMPGTAAYTNRVFLGDKRSFKKSELKKPEKNVELGSMYIRIHTAHAMDNVALALAGYNAGPAPLESWVQRYGDRELDAWVESITYQEARGYVRKVFTSYVTYSALYGGELPELSLEVPKKLRKWGDVPELDRVKKGEPVSLRLDRVE